MEKQNYRPSTPEEQKEFIEESLDIVKEMLEDDSVDITASRDYIHNNVLFVGFTFKKKE